MKKGRYIDEKCKDHKQSRETQVVKTFLPIEKDQTEKEDISYEFHDETKSLKSCLKQNMRSDETVQLRNEDTNHNRSKAVRFRSILVDECNNTMLNPFEEEESPYELIEQGNGGDPGTVREPI